MKPALYTPVSILAGALLIALAILISSGSIKIKGYQGPTSINPSPVGSTSAAALAQPSPAIAKVALDDDPMLGSKDAPVTMVEFSDYECPFCKRYFDQTYSQIKKDYIDTGKVKLVYRDLPLEFHQNAHKEAEAANCAREQGGDSAYFKFHDEMFTKTTSNGTGLSLDELPTLAEDVGLNGTTLKTCLDSGKYVSEVDKDIKDAQAAGADGTPSFFIGKSGSDSIDAYPTVGAQPYSVFKSAIDALL